jgi:hypothetical protein
VAQGQQFLIAPTYATQSSYLSDGGVNSVAAADFNGDGKIDVVAVRYGARTVIVLLGNGDGTFQESVDYPCGDVANAVITADFNLDGKPDIAVMAYGAFLSTVSILIGNGDGTFQPHVDYLVGINPFWIAVGDVNGDGAPDILTADSNQMGVSVLLNQGNGTFGATMDFATGQVGPIAIADFNGDGKADLIQAAYTSSSSPSLFLFSGNGDGTFQPPVAYPSGTFSNSLAIADFNHDGSLDVASRGASLEGPSISILLGNGSGGFQVPVNYPTLEGSGSVTPNSLAVGDFNKDGKLDLAATNSNSMTILLGNGNGTFQAAVNYGAGMLPQSVVAADLNGDTADDLVVANYNGMGIPQAFGSTLSVLMNNGAGRFLTDEYYPTGTRPTAIVAGDFNGDGKPDMAVANGNPYSPVIRERTLSVLLGNGDGTFQPHADYATGNFPISIASGDFNGDGKQDLVTANHDDDTVSVLLANSDGTFRPHVDYSSGSFPFSVVVGDFDGDGKEDLAVASVGDNSVSILLGNGDGTFRSRVAYATGPVPVFVAAGDVNGDGKLDLATANSGNNTVSVLLGKGDGTFGNPLDMPAGGPPLSIAVGDLNGDGNGDLAVADGGLICGTFGCSAESLIATFQSNGDGTFQPAVTFPSATGPQWIAIGDFNGDGKRDLAVANSDVAIFSGNPPVILGNTASIFWGNGDGTFRPHLDYPTAEGAFAVAVVDLNGDHRDDLAVVNALSNLVTVLLNTPGPPNFILSVTTRMEPNGGGGEVDSAPAGIDRCPGLCNAAYPSGLPVTLTAIPNQGNIFTGWSGACTGTGSCTVTMSADHSVTATFAATSSMFTLNVAKSGSGSGLVAGSSISGLGINCGTTCSVSVPPGTAISLAPFPDAGSGFSGWSGSGCGPGQIECVATMDSNKTVTASFKSGPTLTLTVQIGGTASGAVQISNIGPFPPTSCTSTCSQTYGSGTQLLLYPEASGFDGWGGACSGSGTGTCGITMTSSLTVVATFSAPAPDFSMSATTATPSAISPGQSSTSSVSVGAVNGFTSPVSLTCSVQPSPAHAPQCSLNPNSIAPGTPATLTIATTAPTAAQGRPFANPSRPFNALWLPIAGLALAGISFGSRRKKKTKLAGFLLCSLLVAGLVFQAACGGGGGGNGGGGGTPPDSYTITITGKSGSLDHSTTVTLKVQ